MTSHRYIRRNDLPISDHYLRLISDYFETEDRPSHEPYLFDVSRESDAIIEGMLDRRELEKRPRLMICLGSNWENKRLSQSQTEGFLKRIQETVDGAFVFCWGNEKEKAIAEKMQKQFSSQSIVLDKLSIPKWQRVMKKMDGVISMDSSALHLAGLGGVPTFSVFGPSSKAVYKPVGNEHCGVQGSCPYNKQFKRHCGLLRTCKTGACIKEIDVDTLMEAFQKWTQAINLTT